MDGSRFANALATLKVTPKEISWQCGVDVLCFGGTKNGLMVGEAVLIFNEELKANAPYFHKQTAQLFSKNRFIATQFTALLTDNLWLRMATHANQMAQLLAKEVTGLPGVKINRSVDANAVFVIIPEKVIQPLRAQYPFYEWDAETHEQRWMCSFDTTEEEVIGFVKALKELL